MFGFRNIESTKIEREQARHRGFLVGQALRHRMTFAELKKKANELASEHKAPLAMYADFKQALFDGYAAGPSEEEDNVEYC